MKNKYCWTGMTKNGSLTGGYGSSKTKCAGQADKQNCYIKWIGETPKDLVIKMLERDVNNV